MGTNVGTSDCRLMDILGGAIILFEWIYYKILKIIMI